MIGSKMIQFLIFTFFFFNYSFITSYNIVQNFGADPSGMSDSKNAFLEAWTAACSTTDTATIYVPKGNFLLSQTSFNGPCSNTAITIRINGTLLASSDDDNNWLVFNNVAGVTIQGGTLDGQGKNVWSCKLSGKRCHQGATSLAIYNSRDVTIDSLTSKNSQMFHILIQGCQTVKLYSTTISALENSSNTDGIHIALSSDVTIMNSIIATGDDCISIGPGSSNLWIEHTKCGPGHGISIGSLGKNYQEEGVQNVTVNTATFTRTQNGVRIKTWAKSGKAYVKDVLFQHIEIVDACNPILIDQHYCDNNCPGPGQESSVQIINVKYEDVHGTSASQVAVKLDCSQSKPCSAIQLNEVKLTYQGQLAMASCNNVSPDKSGEVWPSC